MERKSLPCGVRDAMLTDERIEAIFQETDGYVLELASDPAALGPKYFQDIIATCRNYLNRVSLVISELNREKLRVSGELRSLESSYAVDYDDLLSNDEKVKALASIDDRKATVGYLLRDQKLKINELKDQMHSLEAVSKVVNHRSKELHATMSSIKDQKRLMQTEIDTGTFYGDERPSKGSPREAAGIGLDDEDLGDLAEMLSSTTEDDTEEEETSNSASDTSEEVNSEPEPEIKAETTEPPEKSESEDAEVVRFLESPDASGDPTPLSVVGGEKKEDDDIDDVLSMLEGL